MVEKEAEELYHKIVATYAALMKEEEVSTTNNHATRSKTKE